jgi:hypothetical protein
MTDVRRLLVLAGAAVASMDELPPSIRALVDEADEVFVVTPTLPSWLDWLMSDVDRARHEADERLGVVLEQLRGADVAASGAVGDETPLTAAEDHIRAFEPDHLLVALRSPEHAAWQEQRLLDRMQRSFGLPTTVFEIDADGHARQR